jgi:HAD superfamily hydrolase (TIGR01509 family)
MDPERKAAALETRVVKHRPGVYTGRSMKRAFRTILFDWDGTLLDSFPAGYHASVTVLRRFGIELDRKLFLETYSPNWYESYRLLGIPESEWDTADQLWRETYHGQRSELFHFATETLERLKASGMHLGLVTSGNRDRVLREIDRFGLEGIFSAVVCFEDTLEKKPHPAPLERALERLSAEPATAVYVGDRPEDIVMGRRVGAFTIGVESQYGPREILEQSAPDLLVPDVSHVPGKLVLP